MDVKKIRGGENFEYIREIVLNLAKIFGYNREEGHLNADNRKIKYGLRKISEDLETLSIQARATRHNSEASLREGMAEYISYATHLEVEIGTVQLEMEEKREKDKKTINQLRGQIRNYSAPT